MSLKTSTGLRNYALATGSFKAAMALGVIKIYAGTIPATADDSLGSATLLCTITKDGDGVTGLSLAASAASGSISKAAETWSGTNAASGTATFWRFVTSSDTGVLSTTEMRWQGTAATSGSELIMTSTTLASGAPTNIDYFTAALSA